MIPSPNPFKIQPIDAYSNSPTELLPIRTRIPTWAILEFPHRLYTVPEEVDAFDTARASNNDATPITRGRTHLLLPIIIRPSFPSSWLFSIMSIPETSSSSDQNSETTVAQMGLPPNTDICPVFQRFGEVMRKFVQPDG